MKKRIYTAPKMGIETIAMRGTLCGASGEGNTGGSGVIKRTTVDLSSIWI